MATAGSKRLPIGSINYKYPCVMCYKPCKNNVQDSICCSVCDEWVHQTCSGLTTSEFLTYCSPEHADDPYYCDNCIGSDEPAELSRPSATTFHSIDIDNEIINLTQNSVFHNKDDILLSDYFMINELNVEIQKTSENILLIHINTVSLFENYDSIKDMLACLNPRLHYISD